MVNLPPEYVPLGSNHHQGIAARACPVHPVETEVSDLLRPLHKEVNPRDHCHPQSPLPEHQGMDRKEYRHGQPEADNLTALHKGCTKRLHDTRQQPESQPEPISSDEPESVACFGRCVRTFQEWPSATPWNRGLSSRALRSKTPRCSR
ncbi:hypothetical protein MTO96_037454 [Rhipicephalus appendiculatus]